MGEEVSEHKLRKGMAGEAAHFMPLSTTTAAHSQFLGVRVVLLSADEAAVDLQGRGGGGRGVAKQEKAVIGLRSQAKPRPGGLPGARRGGQGNASCTAAHLHSVCVMESKEPAEKSGDF